MLDNSATKEVKAESPTLVEADGEVDKLMALASGDKEVAEAQETEASGPISNQLEAEALVYLQGQEEAALKAFLSSTITVVLQLMPDDNNPQGRLGLISARNDTDPPLFGPPLRGDALANLVEMEPVASLMAELKRLLPQRLAQREEREKQQKQAIAQPTPASTEIRKGKKISTSPQTPVLAEAKSATSEKATLSPSSDSSPSINEGAAETTLQKTVSTIGETELSQSNPAKNSGEDTIPGKTVQLTLF